MKPTSQDEEEQALLSSGKDAQHQATSGAPTVGSRGVPMTLGIPTVLFAGLCYCFASGSMVLLNKHALSPKVC